MLAQNSQGQLGVSDRANRTVPTVVQSLKDQRVIGISCGNRHMVAWTGTSSPPIIREVSHPLLPLQKVDMCIRGATTIAINLAIQD